MNSVYAFTGLITVVGAIVALIIACHLERRSLRTRRGGYEDEQLSMKRTGLTPHNHNG